MVHVVLDINKLSLDDYYQKGASLVIYKGSPPYQRGYGVISRRIKGDGVGNILRKVWSVLLPILKPVAREGLATAGRVATDMAQGQPAKEAVITESFDGMKNLLDQAKDRVNESLIAKAKTDSAQKGNGMRKRKRRVIRKKHDFIGSFVHPEALIKRRRHDAFGFY